MTEAVLAKEVKRLEFTVLRFTMDTPNVINYLTVYYNHLIHVGTFSRSEHFFVRKKHLARVARTVFQ